jgi:hypothetical protein
MLEQITGDGVTDVADVYSILLFILLPMVAVYTDKRDGRSNMGGLLFWWQLKLWLEVVGC